MNPNRPRYEPAPTAFRQNYVEIYVCIGILGVLTAIVFPIFQDAQRQARAVSCLSNGRDLSIALLQYAQDYDEHLPLARSWFDTRLNRNWLRCPELPNPNCIGYAMDERLSGRSLDKIGAPHERRVLLYESSNFKLNAHDPGTSFAAPHAFKGTSVGWVAFVDGHTASYKKEGGNTLVQRGVTLP